MTLLQAVVYGIVQGLTEFLPISSTAHLRILPALVGWSDPGPAFTAVIQCGTLAAVLIYFSRDICQIAAATLQALFRRDRLATHDARLGWMIVVGTIPIVVLGLLLKKHITGSFRSLWVISGALIGLALLLAIAEWVVRRRLAQGKSLRSLSELGWSDALTVGFAQAVALVPGSSRSGVTITGGLFCGLDRATAARFSFLLSLPSVLAAAVFEVFDEREKLFAGSEETQSLIVATIVSGIVGYAAIAFLISYLKSHTTWLFIWYRLALGVALIGLVATHTIPATDDSRGAESAVAERPAELRH